MTSQITDFEIQKQLGTGAFSSVYKVRRISDGQIYALKKVKFSTLSRKEKEMALNEVRILASIKSPYIIRYKESFTDSDYQHLYIVMEFAENGDILGLIEKQKKEKKRMEEQTIWSYAYQLLLGLKSLHDIRILHRDLKGANIFLSENLTTVKLGDMNVSKVAKSNFVQTQTGTPYYTSPEVWKGEPYNCKCDVWSLGCVLYEMAAQTPPFLGRSMSELSNRVIRGQFQPLPKPLYSDELNKFISLCLVVDPNKRQGVDSLLCFPKIEESMQKNGVEETTSARIQLLKTIKLPSNGLRGLKYCFPKAQFQEEKTNSENYRPFSALDQQQKFNQKKVAEIIDCNGNIKKLGLVGQGELNYSVDCQEQVQGQNKQKLSRIQSANQNLLPSKVLPPNPQENNSNQLNLPQINKNPQFNYLYNNNNNINSNNKPPKAQQNIFQRGGMDILGANKYQQQQQSNLQQQYNGMKEPIISRVNSREQGLRRNESNPKNYY